MRINYLLLGFYPFPKPISSKIAPMKLFIAFLVISSSVWSRSVIPEQVVLNPLNIYHKKNKVLEDGSVEVHAVDFSRRGSFLYNKKKVLISKEKFDEYVRVANAVQQMIPDEWSRTEESSRRGTAFHIGHNLVLTNAHVLDPTFTNTTHCSDFRLTDFQNNSYSCKNVLYCNAEHDVCLIEMNTTEKAEKGTGTKKTFSLAQGPALKLKLNYRSEIMDINEEVLTAIGNSGGQGTHYSQGKGVRTLSARTYFYAPITQGNSGGPLLNKRNEVVGIVKLQSKNLIGNDNSKVYNIALPSDYAVELIRKALENDQGMLRKFNQAVIE